MKPLPPQLPIIFMVVMALFSSSLASGGGPVDDIPDLRIEELRVDAGVDSYEITVIIRNLGAVSSGTVMGSFTVEEDISTGRYDLISDFSVPGITSGGHYNVTQRWVPSSTGFHRVSAVIDVDGEGLEIFRYNDIDVVEVFIPDRIDVYSSLDGNPDPDIIGNFFSGVPLPVDFTVTLPEVGDVDLVDHVQIELDGVGRFAQLTADGSFSTSFDLGAYGPGDHILSVNASVAGIPLTVESRRVRISPLPSWIGASSPTHLNFNLSLEAYELTGFLEVPSCVFTPAVDGLEGFNDLLLFDGPADIMVDGYVLLDGTTTLDVQGDLRVKYGDVPWATSFKVRSYLPSPDGPARIALSSSSRMTVESGTLRFDPLTALGLISNETVVLPIEHAMEGNITLDGTLELSDSASSPGIEMSVNMEIEDQRSSFFNSRELGLNQPVLSLNSTLRWESLHELESGGSGWASSGGVTWDIDHALFDMGIIGGNQDIDPYIVERGGEYQLEAAGDDGNWGFISISGRTGTVSSITYREGTSEVEVRSNNLYKSDPQLVYMNDSVPLVAWVESSSYSTDVVTRSNSRRLMYSLGDDLHLVFSEALNLTSGDHIDSQPDLASSPDGGEAAMVWKRDGDGDPLTLSDTRIMISTFNGSSWSEPEEISTGGNGSCEPTISYTSSGDLWAAWEERNGTLSTTYIENTTAVHSGIRSIVGLDGSLLGSPVMDRGDGEHPVISYVAVTEDGWGDMYPAVRRGDKARNSLWDDERGVGQAMPWVQGLSLLSNDAGIFMIWKGPEGTIWASGGNRSDPGGEWSDPIDLVAEGISGVSFDLFLDGDNNFLVGCVDPESGAVSFAPHNLSRRGKAVSIVSPNASASGPGDTIYVEMMVQNIGLFPNGEVVATFLATVRDPNTGDYSDVHLNSIPITFSEMNEVVLWQRYHTVLQYEIGLSLIVTSPGMERISSRFVSVSAFPGLEVRSIDTVGDIDPGENVTISLLVGNSGNAPSGTRTVSVMWATLSTPMTFQGNAMEPLFLRGNLSGEILFQREISIDKGESRSIQFEMEAPVGTTCVWGVIEPLPWEGLSRMGSPVIQISRGSELVVLSDARHIAIQKGENASVTIQVKEGEWVRSRMLDIPYIQGPIPEGLGPDDNGNTVGVWMTNGTGSTIWSEDLPVNNISQDGNMELEVPTDLLDPGEYRIHISQPCSGNPITSCVIDVEISIVSPGSADIDVDERILKGSLGGRYVNANLTWNGNRTVRAMLVTVYNGVPGDGVVISETIVLGMEGGETRTIELGIPVDEGYYLLSFEVSYPDPVGYYGPSDLRLIGSAQIGMFVEDPPQIDRSQEDVDNDADILPSMAMSLAMICVVFGLAIPLKARKKREDDN